MAIRWKKPKKPVFGQHNKSQSTIFDIAEKRKNEGMEAAYRGADTEWKRAATECLQRMIATQEFVTSEDVVLELKMILPAKSKFDDQLNPAPFPSAIVIFA